MSSIPEIFADKTLRLWVSGHSEVIIGKITDANEVLEDILLTVETTDGRILKIHQSQIGSWESVPKSA